MYGIDWKQRGAVVEEKLQLLLKAKTGEPFEHEGRRIQVTPPPITPGGPMVMWGGGSIAAANARRSLRARLLRAERQRGHAGGLRGVVPRARARAGHDPAPAARRRHHEFVADDVDKAWDEIGEYILHDVKMYGDVEPGRGDHRQHLARADGRGAAGDVAGAQDLQHRGGDARSCAAACRSCSCRSAVASRRRSRGRTSSTPPTSCSAAAGLTSSGVGRTVPGHQRSRRHRRRPARRRRGARRRVHPARDGRGHPRRGRRARRGRGSGHAHGEPRGAGVLRPAHQARVGARRGVAHVRQRGDRAPDVRRRSATRSSCRRARATSSTSATSSRAGRAPRRSSRTATRTCGRTSRVRTTSCRSHRWSRSPTSGSTPARRVSCPAATTGSAAGIPSRDDDRRRRSCRRAAR